MFCYMNMTTAQSVAAVSILKYTFKSRDFDSQYHIDLKSLINNQQNEINPSLLFRLLFLPLEIDSKKKNNR